VDVGPRGAQRVGHHVAGLLGAGDERARVRAAGERLGQAQFLKADMVRPGAVVVDVGTNRVDGKWVGDVDFEAVRQVAAHISPVPGGVGPMTITMLLYNTLDAARTRLGAP